MMFSAATNKEILACIAKVEKDKDTEFEIRFGNFINDNFDPDISLENFINLQKFINNFAKLENIQYSFIAVHKDKTRVTQILEPPKTDLLSFPWKNNIIKKEYIIKKNIKNIDEKKIGIRCSLSKETKIIDTKNLFNTENPAIYFKSRKRFRYKWKGLIIELSMYKSSNDLNSLEKKEFKYDIEVEIDQNVDNINEINSIMYGTIEYILKIIQDTNVVLYKDEIISIKNKYSKLTKTEKFIGSQPETISSSKLLPDEHYAMTMKLDGKRRLMFICNNFTYLIDSKLRISNLGIKTYNQDNTLLDGELYKNKFYVFDVLFHNAKDLRNLTLKKRIENVNTIVNNINNKNIIVKEYIYENIYNEIQKYITEENTLTDKAFDGFIFVPINKTYPKFKNENVPLKWKPEKLNTIDFKIKKLKSEKNYELWVLMCSNDQPFYYEDDESLSIVKIDINIAMNYMDNTVVEFYFDKITEQFYPLKSRYDKTQGNYIDVAKNNFESIMEPFDLQLLKEENKYLKRKDMEFYNMRRYHNWIKRILISTYSAKSGNLLDLACGKGGDIQKWVDNNIKYVEGYDIDEKSIIEAKERFSKIITKPTSKNFLYNFSIKDLSSEIIDTSVEFDLASCFFAIHYFYKSKEKLDIFIKNLNKIKENGYFIITTLDDKSLKNIDYTYNSKNLSIKKNNIQSNSVFDNSINVYIKDCVLDKETTEYVVDFDFTVKFMAENNFDLVETKMFSEYYKAWKEYNNFLNIKEKNYSFMNRVYVFKKKSNNCENLSIWSLKKLKEYCKSINIDSKGKKDELIDRIKNLKL